MAYTDMQVQKSLERIAASLEKIQKDLRSIAESANQFSKALEAFKTKAEQAKTNRGKFDDLEQDQGSDLFIERVKKYYANGLSNAQIADLLDVDYWIVRNITSAQKGENNG